MQTPLSDLYCGCQPEKVNLRRAPELPALKAAEITRKSMYRAAVDWTQARVIRSRLSGALFVTLLLVVNDWLTAVRHAGGGDAVPCHLTHPAPRKQSQG